MYPPPFPSKVLIRTTSPHQAAKYSARWLYFYHRGVFRRKDQDVICILCTHQKPFSVQGEVRLIRTHTNCPKPAAMEQSPIDPLTGAIPHKPRY